VLLLGIPHRDVKFGIVVVVAVLVVVAVVVAMVVRGKIMLHQSMPESLSALFRIVSFTAAKTRRMLDVSVAWVKLHGDTRLVLLLLPHDATPTLTGDIGLDGRG